MSVRLRLKRVGATKQPHYRLIAVDKRRPRDGAELEVLGHYDPKDKSNAFSDDDARVKYWLSCGAQPSDTVKSLLVRTGFYKKPEAAAPPSA